MKKKEKFSPCFEDPQELFQQYDAHILLHEMLLRELTQNYFMFFICNVNNRLPVW